MPPPAAKRGAATAHDQPQAFILYRIHNHGLATGRHLLGGLIIQQDKVAPEIAHDADEVDEVEADQATDEQLVGGGFDWDAV